MLAKLRSNLTYANVVATTALFLVVAGGGAYAVTRLKNNSVTSAKIKNGQVKAPDLAGNSVNGSKVATDALTAVDLAPGAVGTSELADGAVTGLKLQPPGPFTAAGLGNSQGGAACGATGFVDVWADLSPGVNNVTSYYRDPYGIVHMRGVAIRCQNAPDPIVGLPAGYRPAFQEVFGVLTSAGPDRVDINPDGAVQMNATPPPMTWVSLDGISFRCDPSGSNGCP